MDKNEFAAYQESLKDYWDLKSSMDTYFDKGKIEGKIEEKIEMAIKMLKAQEPLDKIILYTELPQEKIEEIKKENSIF